MSDLRVAFVTLGCARNDVDSDELAARLVEDGWSIVADADQADAVVVNTCGFVEAAKKDSIDMVLSLQADSRPVVAVGCLAERYGQELADELPEADAVLGFDSYSDIGERLRAIVGGQRPASHVPTDRRRLLPITPVERPLVGAEVPGHGAHRLRLERGPTAPLKIASGCDRRCTFCAIPSFRGSFISRRTTDVLAEARQLVDEGVRELNLVSENSTSYGKDLGDLKLLETLLPEMAALHPQLRIRLAYLQPAEMRPGLVAVIGATPGVAPYFDMSFQHASSTVLRRMRRFGGIDDFLDLVARIREVAPEAGIRTNVIVGFPGETLADIEILEDFLIRARLDAVGVFAYSDEDGTAAVKLDGKVPADEIAERRNRLVDLVEELAADRADERIGSSVQVLVETVEDDHLAVGRAQHQGPEDGEVLVTTRSRARIGQLIHAKVESTEGVDLLAREVDR